MSVSAVHPCTLVTKLARYLRMQKHAFVPLLALWEESALVHRMVILALLRSFVAIWEVSTTHLLFGFRSLSSLKVALTCLSAAGSSSIICSVSLVWSVG